VLVGGGPSHRINVAKEIKAFEEDTSIERYTKGYIYSSENGTEYTPDEILRPNFIFFERPMAKSMVPNDCSTHTINYLFRHPIFTMREQVHRLAYRNLHMKASKVDQLKKKGGYSLKIFNDFIVKDGVVYSLKELHVLDISGQQGYVELQKFVEAGMIHSDFRSELVLVGSGFREEAYTHSSVFLRHQSAKGIPLILHLDCDQTHPQCSEPRLLDMTSVQLDFKYFSRYQLMRIFALDRRDVSSPEEELQIHAVAKEIIEGKKEDDPELLKEKHIEGAQKSHSTRKRKRSKLQSRKGSAQKSRRGEMSSSDKSEMLDLTVPFNLGEQSDIDSDFEKLHVFDSKEEEKMPQLPSNLDEGHAVHHMESPLAEMSSLVPYGQQPA
jgi:hypothetical protein